MNLIILNQSEILDGGILHLLQDDPRLIHIINILKLSKGDTFKAGVLGNSFGIATIQCISSNHMIAQYDIISSKVDQHYPIHLFLGSVRPLVMKRLLKDITSMGVDTLSLFTSDKGERSYLESSLWKNNQFEEHVIEGLSQAVSINPPTIQRYNSLSEALQTYTASSYAYILDPYAKKTWREEFSAHNRQSAIDSIYLIIGSERGFSQEEMHLAQQKEFLPISITPRILRTETATIATLTLASQLFA
ncbi:RsmE family RNA methyltransferase [Entomospira nematocerorum]|uniref:Ribosomal RNA small subunit methyltransferase E n=1 Tax=Entomospira nematocerorum TaxID=2719987 RepID=A0A968KSG4_9SPIO|nr:RsmE family RNA methyltransferase [Entomospira nematocera]NIZ46426.1 RNA methyltransferase [Entomospira nematocera]WDI33771.1 RsmE family RNA methyltransferase [Entomospira nematocera]